MNFKTKLILLTGISLLVGMVLTAAIAFTGINGLSDKASDKIEEGLLSAYREYLQNYIQANSDRLQSIMVDTTNDIQSLTTIVQTFEDNQLNFQPVSDATVRVPLLTDDLKFNKGGWYQNNSDSSTVLTVLPAQIKPDGNIKQEVIESIRQTAFLQMLFPIIKNNGVDKTQIYYYGPPEAPYRRAVPWADYGASFAKSNPDYLTRSIWDSESKQHLTAAWQNWVTDPSSKKGLNGEVTVIPAYVGNISRKVTMSFNQPVWDVFRKKLRGSLTFTLELNNVNKLIEDIAVNKTGFAFLAQQDGNVLAIKDSGEKLLGLSLKGSEDPKAPPPTRYLKDSSLASVSSLQFPEDGNVKFNEIQIKGEPYIVVLDRLDPLNTLNESTNRITPESWTLGFVVNKKELLTTLYAAQKDIDNTTQTILTSQLAATILALVVVIALVYLISNRMTRSLKAMQAGAVQIQQKNYNVQVDVKSRDEFGQLATTFNNMASDIKQYTENLEGLVKQRTRELEDKNEEMRLYIVQASYVTAAAAEVQAGTFEPASLNEVSKREDQLGQLARVFQHMAREVDLREKRLVEQVRVLKIEIDQTKKAKQVAEITETDYFQDLQSRATSLRNRSRPTKV